MRKIETIFLRDPKNMKLVLPEPNRTGAGIESPEWVFDGHGVATLKVDGTCCLWLNDKLYRRHMLKQDRPVPVGWLHWTMNPAQKSGHGWLPVSDNPADDYHRGAAWYSHSDPLNNRTYELCGPMVNGNPQRLDEHYLLLHGTVIPNPPERTFDALRDWFRDNVVEGIVWWWVRPGGTWGDKDTLMAKIKRKDFGLPWPAPQRVSSLTAAAGGDTDKR